MDTRVEKLVGNKLLRISTLLDPRISYDETIFSKAHWGFIEEDLIEFIKKENLKITTQEDNFVTSSLDEIDSLSDKSDDSVTRYDIWKPKSPRNVSTISVDSDGPPISASLVSSGCLFSKAGLFFGNGLRNRLSGEMLEKILVVKANMDKRLIGPQTEIDSDETDDFDDDLDDV
uniref:Uncharacterized protein n=2 Tax=Meloidogyne incognita group TaxID=654580 RepID=A0A914KZA7_MELIC